MIKSKEKIRHDKNNEYLHNLLGIHYHKGIVYPDGTVSRYKCSCMDHQSMDPLWRLNKDLLSPIGFKIVMEYIIIENKDLWNKYVTWCYQYTPFLQQIPWVINGTELIKMVSDLSNLVKFIRAKNIFKDKTIGKRSSRFFKNGERE
jgi:hypothetical protein